MDQQTWPARPQWGAPPRAHAVTFTGSTRDYFGIWIVNVLLSIVTLGIYTAWAKVRWLRYFYGNTHIDGHSFEYHARPVQILIGRLIVVAALVIINVASQLTLFVWALLIPYLIALPWIFNKAIAFNARMTSYRNVRFGFAGNYWHALGIFLLMPIGVALTGGLLAPVMSRMYAMYMGGNTKYGAARFHTDTPLSPLYRNLGATVVFTIAAGVLCVAIGAGIGAGVAWVAAAAGLLPRFDPQTLLAGPEQVLIFGATIGGVLSLYLTSFLSFIFYRAGVRNIAFRHTALEGGFALSSDLSRSRYVWIIVTNFLAMIFTLGLARPWAMIRTWRYLAAHTVLHGPDTLGAFVEAQAQEGQVVAAEFLDIEGIDFGL